MKTVLLALVLLTSSLTAKADFVTGDKIEFQANSTFVSAVFSKTLCVDGNNFQAVINKCVQRVEQGEREGDCLKSVKILATQPLHSTRERCAAYESDSSGGDCARWETVAYNQSPVRTVKFYKDSNTGADTLVKTISVTIPACGNPGK